MTSVSTNVYFDKLDYIFNKYNKTYYKTNMKPFHVKSNTYIDSSEEMNNKNPKFKISDTARISKYTNIFAKAYNPNWSEEGFVIQKVKNNVLLIYIISDLKGEEIVGKFCENELQKANQQWFRI